MSKTMLLYKDVAPGADRDAAVAAVTAQPFADPALLPFGADTPPGITCEPNQWGLDGTFAPARSAVPAFWSTAISGPDGRFAAGEEPVLEFSFGAQYTSAGVTLRFDPAGGGYCTAVNLRWYQGEALLAEADFTPDGVDYFCRKRVEHYDRLVLTLQRTNLPHRYARLSRVLFGVHRSFGMAELRAASAVNQLDLLSAELPVSRLNWTLDSREDVDYLFQLKQPVEVRSDGVLVGVYYVDGSSRTARHVYPVECCDAIGVLDEMPFDGGVYSGTSARALAAELASPFQVEVDGGVPDAALTGVLLPGTRRGALQQVLFAWGACASTDGRASIRVFVPGAVPAEVPEGRVFLGTAVDTAAVVTEVQVTAHTYAPAADGTVTIHGTKYSDTTAVYTVKNPDVTATDKQNIVQVTGATLVSPAIGQAVAQRVYDHCRRRSTHRAKVVFAGERLGDCLTVPDGWGGRHTGNLMKLELKLSNTVVYGGELRGV